MVSGAAASADGAVEAAVVVAGAEEALLDISALHVPVDATSEPAIEMALRRATAALLGQPAGRGDGGLSTAPTASDAASPSAAASPSGAAGRVGAQPAAAVQALAVQRLGAGPSGAGSNAGAYDSLLWPPDHTAWFPLASSPRSTSTSGAGSHQSSPEVILELFVVSYSTSSTSGATAGSRSFKLLDLPASGTEDPGSPTANGSSSAEPRIAVGGPAFAALMRQRQAQQAASPSRQTSTKQRPLGLQKQGSVAASRVTGRLVARLVLRQDMLAPDQVGQALILDGLPLLSSGGASPGGASPGDASSVTAASLGTATVEAVLWDMQSLVANLQLLAGPERGGGWSGGSGPHQQQWPETFIRPGTLLPPGAGSIAAAGLAGAYSRGAAALLLATLGGDMVAKQAALERLQRQLDAADARCEVAAGRLRDLMNRNQ